MTWRFVGADEDRHPKLLPLPGIPLVASDDDFEEAVKRYEGRYGPEARGAVKRSGLYKQDKPEKEPVAESDS